jgi:hypothetical protein
LNSKPAGGDGAAHKQFREGRSFVKESVISATLHYGRKGKTLYHNRLVPGVKRVSRPIKNELIKIHRKRNMLDKVRVTLIHKGLGLYLAMISAGFVSRFIEVRSVNNMWGLFTERQLVSESTFSIVSFGVEFLVALTVFTITEHYLGEFREWRRRQKKQS